jgi:hypothetical protein
MLQDLQVRHLEYETTQAFEDVTSASERVVGTVEGIGWESMRNASKSARPASQDAHVHDRESTDQWMIVVIHMKSK